MIATVPRVAVVYNPPFLPPEHPDATSEADVVRSAAAVVQALESTGFRAEPFPAAPPVADFLHTLDAHRPDLIFNLVEAFAGRTKWATHLTAALELLGRPCTGSPVESFVICQSKERTKALLRGRGLPTAPAVLIGTADPIPDLGGRWPVLVKPDEEDGSLGIDQGSVVGDLPALTARVEVLRALYTGGVLVEQYLPGPEFNVGVVAFAEPRALPVAQAVFPEGLWPILTFAGKWHEDSIEYRDGKVLCPAPVEPELGARLAALAEDAFRAAACCDYGRVDLRLDSRGEPMILEVNSNPDLSPGAGLARAAGVAGYRYEEFIAAIARQALARAGRSG